MAVAPDFSKMVPGFDFLQSLATNAGNALPGLGQWVAPTLDPQELGKRIEELKTVQFWLEQNGRMIGATIQAISPSSATSGTPPTRVATTGSPRVIASSSALGIASERDGITSMSLAL